MSVVLVVILVVAVVFFLMTIVFPPAAGTLALPCTFTVLTGAGWHRWRQRRG